MVIKEKNKASKSKLGKAWDFIWNSNSIWSWILSIILAFIIVKFAFFPLLSLVLGTSMPLVVVESSSMHHSGSFIGNTIGLQDNFQLWWEQEKSWYETRGITREQAGEWRLNTGLEKGDIVVVTAAENLEVGDIIIFNANQAHPVIHRIVNIKSINGEIVYSTKGDNNSDQLYVEKQIPEDALVGKAVFKIPKLGWLKLALVEFINGFRR